MDRDLYEQINGWAAAHHWAAHVFEVLAVDAIYIFAVVLVVLVLAPSRWTGGLGRTAAISAGLSAALALGLAQVLSRIVERPRPFVAQPENSHLLVDSARDFTLPSDHATAGFAIAVAIALRMPRLGAALVLLAIAIAFSRVAVGAHYPGDALAGAALGTGCASLISIPSIRTRIDGLTETVSQAISTRLTAVARSEP